MTEEIAKVVADGIYSVIVPFIVAVIAAVVAIHTAKKIPEMKYEKCRVNSRKNCMKNASSCIRGY